MPSNSFGPPETSSDDSSESATETGSSTSPSQALVKHEPDSQQALPLVYGRQFTDDSILVVCIGRHNFFIHRQHLSKCSPTLVQAIDESSGEDFSLQLPSPDAFGLFLDWLYTKRLHPQQYGLPRSKSQADPLPDGNEGLLIRFSNLDFLPLFPELSAEEFRLIEHGGQHGFAYLNHICRVYVHTIGQNDVTKLNSAMTYLRGYGLNPPTPNSVFQEHFLFLALELAIFAQQWGMQRLHNTAIESYRLYEHQQARQHPLMEHIRLVYENSPLKSRLRQLMADYAFTVCKLNNSRADIFPTFIQHPEFLQDLIRRDDDPKLIVLSNPLSCKEKKNAYPL